MNEEQPEYRLLTGTELDILCQNVLNSLPKYPGSKLQNPYAVLIHCETGFQTLSNLDNDTLRRFVSHFASEMEKEPTDLGSYTPPSRN